MYEVTEFDIKRTQGLASRMARKWDPGLISFDEVYSAGLEGLTHAALNFDEKKGVHPERNLQGQFWAYATVTIRGYMSNSFRDKFGQNGQKLAIAKAESLSIQNNDSSDEPSNRRPLELSTEVTWNSGTSLLEKIRGLDVTPVEKQIMILLAVGYLPAEIGRMLGMNKMKTYRTIRALGEKISKDELLDMIDA